jgi:NAD(P)-dependent dehydrogenase (short-subunit alcohol dehydrogenase family)
MSKLAGKTILVTGAAVRIGRALSIAVAKEGANLVLQYNSSKADAETLQEEITALGQRVSIYQVDFSSPEETLRFSKRVFSEHTVDGLVNNASIFSDLAWYDTDIEDWNDHLAINLTAPYILSREFALSLNKGRMGRIINLLDWRALRPGPDHLPYTISKSGLAALTKSLAISLAPAITVNGIALGAILPPSDGGEIEDLVSDLPLPRWADLEEVADTLLFLLDGPSYITGEIIHLDGGRHLI